MSFTDLNFLFRFLPVCLIIYSLVPVRLKKAVLLAESLIFYVFEDIRFLFLLLALILWNYLAGLACMERKKPALAAGIVIDVIALCLAKFLSRTVDSALLPVGMSFYIFKMIAYLSDAWCGRISGDSKKAPSLADAAVYFCMFPQILSGPIMRYEDYRLCGAFESAGTEKTLRERFFLTCGRIENGLTFFIPGLAAKVLIADHLNSLWESLNTIGYESISTPLAWLGVYSRSLEIYFDFWGYSLMAGGLGVMFGFPFIKNFDQPYSAGGVAEFYRRWHITLGRWFRDYIYIPLGGSRHGWQRTAANLAFVWLLTGLWHGVTFNFILWAAAVFFMILVEKELMSRNSRALKAIGRLNVLVFIPLTWVIFAITDPFRLRMYFLRLFPVYGNSTGVVYAGDFVKTVQAYGIYIVFALVFLSPAVYHYFEKYRRSIAVALVLAVFFVLSTASIAASGANPFMYAQF